MRGTLSAPRRPAPEAPNPAPSRRICAHDFCKKGTSVNRKCLVFARAFPSFQDIRAQQDCKRLAAKLQTACDRLAGRCLPETKKNCGSVSTLPQRIRPALASFPPFARRCGRRLCHLAAAVPRPCPPIASEPNARSRLRGTALRRRIFLPTSALLPLSEDSIPQSCKNFRMKM